MKSYIVGFGFSLFLSVLSFVLISAHIFPQSELVFMILFLALVQLSIQLIFFLHLGQESKPRWHLLFFISTISIVLMIIVGSLWIMSNLNYNMTPTQINSYMSSQDGF